MWFVYALITTLAWGAADLFYKKGADEKDRFSHLKTSMIVGFIMGGHAITTLLITGVHYDPINLVKYLPVSAMYILSMTVGYFGLRYLMLSISSPIQNSSGAVSCILCLIILGQTMDILSAAAVFLICAGVFLLGLLEHMSLNRARKIMKGEADEEDSKYRIGFVAFFMPIIYCIIDALGTFFDAYYLDDFETTPLVGVTEDTLEIVANISYELTFLICGVILAVYMIAASLLAARYRRIFAEYESRQTDYVNALEPDKDKNENKKNRYADKTADVPYDKSESRRRYIARILAACFETGGQATYVYAMSGNGVVAAPMVASYSIISLILSRIFLKEKLTRWQYCAVALVIIGIFALGLVEGLGE